MPSQTVAPDWLRIQYRQHKLTPSAMNLRIVPAGAALLLAGLSSCGSLFNQGKGNMGITSEVWGSHNGKRVELFTMENKNGMEVKVTNYGGIIVSLEVPDKKGAFADVVLGFDTLKDYETRNPFFGALTGRYANRIAKGRFTLDGTVYQLAVNNGPNSLHGGKIGFDKKVWTAKKIYRSGAVGLEMTYTSPDGEEGYPGTLSCRVTYLLTNRDELRIEYSAATDKATVVNLTNHSYFNLSGEGSGPVLDHLIEIDADSFTPTDNDLIPTGATAAVAGTPMDFTESRRIGDRIDENYLPLKQGLGYDHNYVLSGGGRLRTAATVKDPKSGRVMTVSTTEPAVQLYTSNHMKKMTRCKNGHTYDFRGALCLETQHYPDSPNHPNFPSTVLRPGETYQQTTVYKFSVE